MSAFVTPALISTTYFLVLFLGIFVITADFFQNIFNFFQGHWWRLLREGGLQCLGGAGRHEPSAGMTKSSVQLTGSSCPLLPIPCTWLLRVLEEILIWWKSSGFAWVENLGSPAMASLTMIGIKGNSTTESRVKWQNRAENHPNHLLPFPVSRQCMSYISLLHLMCHLAGRCRNSITDQLLVHLCLSVSFSAFQGKMKCINVHKLPLMGCAFSIYTQALEV